MASQESRLIISIDSRNAERTARNLSEELRNITLFGNQADRQMSTFGSSLRNLAGAMAGVLTVGTAISKMDMYTGLQNRLKLVTANQMELNTALKDTFSIAQTTAQAWDSVAQVYQRFADNSKTLGITLKQTASLTETVAKSISISGGSAASAEAALVQFGQALASGVLRGEEFNSIAEQAPALLKAIANGLGVNIGQLRSMAAEGKLTGDVLIKSLEKSKESVDNLFSKTDFTVAQSFTQLNNAVTQFIGEAGKANGSASLLSSSIKSLADNLGAIANVAVLGGVALLTKTILTQVVATKTAITASIERRASLTAELQAQIQLSAVEVQRARQATALALTETNLARIEYNRATSAAARAVAIMRLTQAEIAYRIALQQQTATIASNVAAQNALNASRAIGARALALVGGPIGALTIGVTALAAGYMYMQHRTEEANKKLEEQASVANKTADELRKLNGVEKQSAINDMTAALEAQNKALKANSLSVSAVLIDIQNMNKGNIEVAKISNEARSGTISYSEALSRLNKLEISPSLYNELKRQVEKYDESYVAANKSAEGLKVYGVQSNIAGSAAQNASAKHNMQANSLDGVAGSATGAANALSEYAQKANEAGRLAKATNALLAKGYDANLAKDLAEIAVKRGKVTTQEAQAVIFKNKEEAKLKATIDARADAERKASAASKKASSERLREQKKENKDNQRLADEKARDREQIHYESANRIEKIEIDLSNKLKQISEARFSPEDTRNYLEVAKNRADLEKQIFIAEQEYEINEFQFTEQEKLDFQYKINKLRLQASTDLDEDLFNGQMARLTAVYNEEISKDKLAKEERIFQAKQALMTESEIMNERYRLELENIKLVKDESERTQLTQIANAKRLLEIQDKLKEASEKWASTQAEMGGYTNYTDLENTKNERIGQSQALFDSQMQNIDPNLAYEEQLKAKEKILLDHNERMNGINKAHQLEVLKLNLGYGEQITGSLADMYKSMRGEQSKGFKVLFAAEKAFALARATIALGENISRASSVGFPFNLPLIAGAVAQGATIFSIIRSAKDAGFQSGGYTGNGGVSDVAGVVHGKEYVLNAQATKRVGVDTLNAVNSGGSLGSNVNVIVNVPQGYTAVQTQNESGVTIDVVRKEAQNAVNASWQNLSNANSNESKSVQRSFGLSPAR